MSLNSLQEPTVLHQRLEKLARQYDVETMKVFMVVEALGEKNLHAVYSPDRKLRWQNFLSRQEACRLDLGKHERTRECYHKFLHEVEREEQGKQWFHAVMHLLKNHGAADIFNYVSNHSPRPHVTKRLHQNEPQRLRLQNGPKDLEAQLKSFHQHHDPHNNKMATIYTGPKDVKVAGAVGAASICTHLARLFEKKLEVWFDSFQAVAVKLTAHVKVSGLVRVLSGQVHALCTRQGRLHVVAIKVTAQESPRPLDVAELCLAKVMAIQNGLALPEDLGLALLTLHVHPARPVLRLWRLTPTPEMETAICTADIDDMIDAGRLSQFHELWPDNIATDTSAGAGTPRAGVEM